MTLGKNQITAGSAHDPVNNLVRNEVGVKHECALFIKVRLLVLQDRRFHKFGVNSRDMLELCAECLMESPDGTFAAGVVAGIGHSYE
ncbi:unnamed protein product [Clonostachys rosea]|uniref:Uncharacterized protein n=1 Tax=Bionectria ochroleuca TaxID=29856 RepID=A0ABY6UIW4_BIOOC|nr:unnamed protein product [Clonostachys rosea]